MKTKGQQSVSIPKDLWDSLDKLMRSTWAKKYGYRSRTDFIIKAIRDKVEQATGEPSL